jgi:hypothetical protein
VVRALAVAQDGPRVLITSREPPAFAGEVVALGGLEPGPARELAVALTGMPRAVPEPAAVIEVTAGVPSAVEQLAGWINRGDSPQEMPLLLVDVVSVRVNRLDVAARRILQAVAAHGTVAPRWMVESCVPDELDALADPVWTGLLIADEHSFTIPSELVATVVWACTPADVRRRPAPARPRSARPRRHRPASSATTRAGRRDPRAHAHYLDAGADAERRFDDLGAALWYGRAVGDRARAGVARPCPDAALDVVEASLRLAEVLRHADQPRLATGALDEAMTRHAERAPAAPGPGGPADSSSSGPATSRRPSATWRARPAPRSGPASATPCARSTSIWPRRSIARARESARWPSSSRPSTW